MDSRASGIDLETSEGAKADPYPGELASETDLARLADEYRSAAHEMRKRGRKGNPVSMAPCRLMAVHAIELYLSLFLRRSGMKAGEIRALRHDLVRRLDLTRRSGLVLRNKTSAHLVRLSENREYLIARYAPDLAPTMSQINRLLATLDEIAKKVEARRVGQVSVISAGRPAIPGD